MSEGWENHEPAPMEFFHGRLQKEFHKWRKQNTEETTIEIDVKKNRGGKIGNSSYYWKAETASVHNETF